MNTKLHAPDELVTNWQDALQFLKDGNQRFIDNTNILRSTNEADREATKDSQKPFAVIVTCSDSRVSPEIYFDQKIGDIFVIRNAGNIADITALGSLEFAVEHLGAPLVVVVGHSACGAVKGAISEGEFSGNLDSIIRHIRGVIDGQGKMGLEQAINENVRASVKAIQENAVVKKVAAKVLGAHSDVASGEVVFISE